MTWLFPILCYFSISVFNTVGDSYDYQEFIKRWPLNDDLPCIHRTIDKLGPEVPARKSEPNWKGQRTYCFFLQETPVSVVYIYKWPSSYDGQLAAAFVKRLTPNIPFSRESRSIEGCSSLTNIDSQNPPWLNEENQNEVVRKLQSHCFYKNHNVGLKKPIKMIFKVSRKNGNGNNRRNATYFEGKTIRYVIPRDDDFIVADREKDVDKLCTRCNGGGGFGQPGLVNSTSLNDVLKKIKDGTYS